MTAKSATLEVNALKALAASISLLIASGAYATDNSLLRAAMSSAGAHEPPRPVLAEDALVPLSQQFGGDIVVAQADPGMGAGPGAGMGPPPPGPGPGGVAMPPPFQPQCVPVAPNKTADVKIRGLGRLSKPLGMAKAMANAMNKAVSVVTGAATGASCKPYTMLTANLRREDWAVGCCPVWNQPVVMETFKKIYGGINFQWGMNCEYPIGAGTILGPLGMATIGAQLDKLMLKAKLIPLLRLQGDLSLGGGGSYMDTPPPTCPVPTGIGINASAMGQVAGSFQFGYDNPGAPQDTSGFWKWPPWSNKYFIRLTLQLRGNGGGIWTDDGVDWAPRPNVQGCFQRRVRLWDFIDVDASNCMTFWTM